MITGEHLEPQGGQRRIHRETHFHIRRAQQIFRSRQKPAHARGIDVGGVPARDVGDISRAVKRQTARADADADRHRAHDHERRSESKGTPQQHGAEPEPNAGQHQPEPPGCWEDKNCIAPQSI